MQSFNKIVTLFALILKTILLNNKAISNNNNIKINNRRNYNNINKSSNNKRFKKKYLSLKIGI